ncbi:MAG: TIGR00725 family protein [Calditrichaeota bacterium]|nr:MAG: TIGR00725 family protein [Calditrichota bacterium]
MPGPLIGVFGGSDPDPKDYLAAEVVGREIARRGGIVVCGGLFGIMEAVCKGAREQQGLTVGILPSDSIQQANRFVTIPIATGMGVGRNILIVRTAQVCIAINGRYGTLSEIAYALQLGKPVVALHPWLRVPGIEFAQTPAEAVDKAFQYLR